MMSSMLSPINVDALESGFRAFLPNVTIFSKDLGRTNINLFDAQDYFLDELFAGLRQDIHWFVTAKGRQLGLTTICLLLDCFWCGTVPDVQGAVVFDTQQNKDKFRILLQDMLKNLPPAFRLPTSKFDRDFITFKNGNMLDFLTAGIKKGQGTLGRSRALNFVHGCMAPGTPIIVEHGRIKLIEDIKIGDQVLTHTGNLTKVIDVLGQPNQKGPLIRITPWLGDSLEFTREHNIPTQRGTITADEVNHWDWLVMPRRKIIDTDATVLLPLPKTSHSIGAGETFSLNDRMGFVVGYYLAEGTILHQRNSGRASGVQFTRHRQEKTYADEAIRILQGCNLVGKRTTIDFPNSLSSADIVYGSAFSQWLCDVFGETNSKHIPDSVFSYGEAFCTGLVRGLLCGDGSKGLTHLQGYIINEMILPTTRASIAMQARDLVAALGWGWGSIHYKHGAVRRGRIEKPQWRVKWNGQAAKSLRHLLDLPASPMGQPHTEKYKLEDDRILIAIRLIERDIECEEIWDISVEHEDHTFRTPYMSVGNTEICSFGDPDAFEAFKDTLSDQFPARLYLFESTARGPNLFMDLWEEAGEDPITRKQIFIGWWRKETNRYRTNTRLFTRYGYPEKSKWELDSENEVKRVYGVEITLEQWAWFRHRLDPRASSEWSADDNSTRLEVVHEEHPTTNSDLFRQTGSSFIPGRMLKTAAEEAAKHPFKGYKYYIGEDLSAVRLEQLPAAFRNQIQLRIWQEPTPGGRYVLAADPAYASGDESDFFVISVFRVYADRCAQVAEFAERNMFEYQFAWVMAHLSNYYGLCRIILDVNGPGQAVLGEFRHLRQMLEGGALDVRKASDQITEQDLEQNRHFRSFFSGVRNYLYHRFDSFGGGYNLQWKSTVELQASMWAQFRDQLLTGHLQIYSQECLAQIRRLVQEGMYITAEGRGKKDRAVAAAMANRCWIDMERRSLIEEGRTFDAENSNPQLTQVNTVGQYISMAFRDSVTSKEAQRQAANRMTSRPAWRAGVWRGRGRQ